jgi:hypothetical protein
MVRVETASYVSISFIVLVQNIRLCNLPTSLFTIIVRTWMVESKVVQAATGFSDFRPDSVILVTNESLRALNTPLLHLQYHEDELASPFIGYS